MNRRGFTIGIWGAVAALSMSAATIPAAMAQSDFPTRPITLIVPYAAGGATDAAARLLAAELEDILSVSVQVENRPGAASQVGLTALANARPDGYTLSYAVIPTILSHYIDESRGAIYDRESFQPVAMHHLIPAMIAVPTDSPYETLDDLVEAAAAAPQSVSVSDSGLLGNPHLATLLLGRAADVEFASVHFDGGAPSITAMLGGHVHALAGGLPDGAVHARSGAARILGIAATERSPFLPDVPTMLEQGYDAVTASATGILAPAGTPPEVVEILTDAIAQVLATEEHVEALRNLSAEVTYMDPEEYAAYWSDAEDRIGDILLEFAGQ